MILDMEIFLQEGLEVKILSNTTLLLDSVTLGPFFCQFSRPEKDVDLKLKLDDQKEIKDFEVVNVQIHDVDHECSDVDGSDSDAEECAYFGSFHEQFFGFW